MKRQLLLGCGASRRKLFNSQEPWGDLVTLDFNEDHKPDVVWDLEKLPLPFDDNEFDEIHAIEVLEHTGAQGDFRFFFAQFSDFWRILKPGGILFATTPRWNGQWAWGDPSHKRIINAGSLVFLSQEQYRQEIGKTPMSDFRFCYKADFEPVFQQESESFVFALKAIK